MEEHTHEVGETQTPAEEDDVEEVTHATNTRQGRDEAAVVADRIAEDDAERYALPERDRRAVAHANMIDDWTEYHEDRPTAIRPEVWADPFTPATPINDTEARFLKTVRIREPVIAWKQGDSS